MLTRKGGGRFEALSKLLLVAIACALLHGARGQLATQPAAFNPFSGQGAPPTNLTLAYPVTTTFALTKLLAVDEAAYTFTIRAYWILSWEDPRTADMIMEPYDSCKFYCSSQPGVFQNSVGQPSCCDGVYVPQAESINAIGYDAQFVPYSYYIYLGPNGTVVYSTRLQGSFSTSFSYEAYPFDSHYLCVDIFTGFFPIINIPPIPGVAKPSLGSVFIIDDGAVLDSQLAGSGDPMFQPGAYRPSNQDVNLAGWEVQQTWADTLNFTYFITNDARALGNDKRISELSKQTAAYTSAGLRVYIEVARVSRGFYIVVVILPIALIILFSFGVFSFSRESLKARINLLVTLFLTLIILQFVLQTILPGAFILLSPFYLILVSYVYTFLLLVLTVVSNAMYTQYRRRGKHLRRRIAKQDFQKWRAAVAEDAKRPAASLDPEEQATTNGQEGPEHLCDSCQEDVIPGQEPIRANGVPKKKEFKKHHEALNELDNSSKPQDIEDIDPATRAWYAGMQSRWYYRIPILRRIAMWHKFVGQNNSQDYLEYCSHGLEYWARFILLILYVAACVTIFGYASSRSDKAAAVHVLPA